MGLFEPGLTNEEKRVSVYSATGIPTIPSEVTHITPLESLNLNWKERDLPEKERTKHVHRLHPYLGGQLYLPSEIESTPFLLSAAILAEQVGGFLSTL